MSHGARTIFIDLVKACNSIRHDDISLSLRKTGTLEMHTRWIEKSCGHFEVMLKIGREDVRLTHGCEVRQVNNVSPILFIVVIQLATEDIMKSLKRAGAERPKIKCMTNESGILCSNDK